MRNTHPQQAAGSGRPGNRPETRHAQRQQADFLDAWLKRELSRKHDGVLAEPLPEEMLRLLRN